MSTKKEPKTAPIPEYIPTRIGLLSKIDEYLGKNPGMTEEGFGWVTIKDTRLVPRLRAGGDLSTRKLDAVLIFFHNQNHR